MNFYKKAIICMMFLELCSCASSPAEEDVYFPKVFEGISADIGDQSQTLRCEGEDADLKKFFDFECLRRFTLREEYDINSIESCIKAKE